MAIKNGLSRETGNIGYIRHRIKTNKEKKKTKKNRTQKLKRRAKKNGNVRLMLTCGKNSYKLREKKKYNMVVIETLIYISNVLFLDETRLR